MKITNCDIMFNDDAGQMKIHEKRFCDAERNVMGEGTFKLISAEFIALSSGNSLLSFRFSHVNIHLDN